MVQRKLTFKRIIFIVSLFFIVVLLWNNIKQTQASISELMGSKDAFEVVKPSMNTTLIQPSQVLLLGPKRPFAVIIIVSMANDLSQRMSIRSTWGKWGSAFDLRIFFMMGFHDRAQHEGLYRKLLDEHRKFDDLILDDFEEAYYKLPGKVLRMLKWFNNTYTNVNSPRFFVKTDHDVFINLPNLVTSLYNTTYHKTLESLSKPASNITSKETDNFNVMFDPSNPGSYFIGGKRFIDAKINNNPLSKWYISPLEMTQLGWPYSIYPTYVNGPCYIMSGNVVRKVYEASLSVPIYPFEDVYITGMVASHKLHLHISDIDEMWLGPYFLPRLKDLEWAQKMVAVHPVESPAAMHGVCNIVSVCNELIKNVVPTSGQPETRYLSCITIIITLMTVNFYRSAT